MPNSDLIETIRDKFLHLRPLMGERVRRYWAATEALALGRGGPVAVSRATGLSRTTIWQGIKELQAHPPGKMASPPDCRRNRRPGGGRPPITRTDRTLIEDLEALVSPTTRGDPQSPLRWTCKSTRKLAEQLQAQGHRVGDRTVARFLREQGYSLQADRKTREGASHPDRDAQFEWINAQALAFQLRGQPVVSVDTKKKELVGDFENGGREWHPRGEAPQVRVHDFADPELGKAIPYGVYDVAANLGWVSVGIDHDTARFATETLRRWWQRMGSRLYPQARELLVTAGRGGSNSSRCRLWKVALQELADDIGLEISVCHLPPGTSKWNKIEHRMFCHITANWRGRPLESREIVVNLIGGTRTTTGLRIEAELDTDRYETGIKVSDAQLAAVRIRRAEFHGEWNYAILPKPSPGKRPT